MCQTSTVRTNTPHTSEAQAELHASPAMPPVEPSRRRSRPGRTRRIWAKLIQNHMQVALQREVERIAAARRGHIARSIASWSGRGSRPAASRCGPRRTRPAGCADRAARRSADGAARCIATQRAGVSCRQQTPMHGQRVLQPQRARKAAMRQQPVITEVDAQRAEHVQPSDGQTPRRSN